MVVDRKPSAARLSTPSYQASDSSAARSRANSGAGVMNEEDPQLQQTISLGNTKTPTVFAFLRPEKRMFTSAGNSIWLLEAQDVHTMVIPPKSAAT
jgi:hypothetical protein